VLELPPGCSADNIDRLADWLELSTLLANMTQSKYELMEALLSAGLIVERDESFPEDADEYDDGGMSEAEGEEDAYSVSERVADDILARCTERSQSWRDGYPFEVQTDSLSPRADLHLDSYAFLLVADLGHHYPQLKDAITPNSKSGRLMEKVVEASLIGILGRAQRFGWPREPSWPTGIDDRIKTLGELLELEVESLTGKTDGNDKDRTLDVVGLLRLEGSYDASLAVFVQCAAGENWKTKLGDPSVHAWHNILEWKCQLVRAVALPWRLGGRQSDWSYARVHAMSNGAIVFDRPRLVAGNPDAHLDTDVRGDVNAWWSSAAKKLPYAAL
jgi:hypothetical protein